MAEYLIQDTTLTAIGDAIRAKTGNTELITPENMSTKIEEIKTGINITTEPLTIEENGTYTAENGKAYTPITVSVPQTTIIVKPLTIEENGTYIAENGKAFSPVVVDVQSGNEFELLNDGKWHFYFNFTNESQLKGYLGIQVKTGTATIDFGDGTSLEITSDTGDTYTYHEYSTLGKYRIDVEGDINVRGSQLQGMGSYLWRPYKSSVGLPTYMYYGAYYGLYALKFVEIPDKVISINNSAFQHCNSIQSIVIPDGVTSIDNSAFYDCGSLQSIVIPNSVTSIGTYTFFNCKSLRSIVMSNGITNIGAYTFYNCDSLQSIVIPDGVTSIDNSAFYDCGSLQSIVIPNSVTSIGDSAFSQCPVLAGNIKIPVCTNIGNNAFDRTSAMNYLFTDWTTNDINSCTFGTLIFKDINETQKIVFATQEIAEVAKNTTNLATYASYIHYVGEEE